MNLIAPLFIRTIRSIIGDVLHRVCNDCQNQGQHKARNNRTENRIKWVHDGFLCFSKSKFSKSKFSKSKFINLKSLTDEALYYKYNFFTNSLVIYLPE